ncbi:hypothetical protein [Arthrobacter sp. 260]|uniref:hypothetical protein n=1 Tax=Arthrobacter sp. 260 TaxID=2735314 RepID=UPI0014911280|nr:hypothetical protein [Arthrobacter sp. 260]NOJ59215.1 hypothetical protein [Arthrobacter sp. 260]
MELLVITVVVLATTLAAGGAISYITRRDRRTQPSTLDTPPLPPRPLRPARDLRPAPDFSPPGPLPVNETSQVSGPAPVPDPPPPAVGAQETTQRPVGAPGVQEGTYAAREALRANQRAMSDPRLSTLDRVQALMASQAFALHLTDQPALPPDNDKKGPRDQREPL